MDGGFGIIAILAGVQKESLALLEGASLSGRLSKLLRMHIAAFQPVTVTEKSEVLEIEYVLGGEGGNETLAHAWKYIVFGGWGVDLGTLEAFLEKGGGISMRCCQLTVRICILGSKRKRSSFRSLTRQWNNV